MIDNHCSARLSDIDLQMVRSIPPGGNWKNIPPTIPSARLDQIRASFGRGEGSRSTYYGRLRPDAPAYTINTYFTRPGNGCHIHYAQDRVLSHREAARLQSFPDSFRFHGNRSDVATQIGNAVPPLLAYQIAQQFMTAGSMVDLFAGAGGLSLGFVWAGWKPIAANDISARFLQTFAANIHPRVVAGDIRNPSVVSELAVASTERTKSAPLFVLGGPPCQGFSTAGASRTMTDERNHLFKDYRAFIDAIGADGFIFENVTGLLNMEGGRVFETVCEILSDGMSDFAGFRVQAEQHAIPQRRSRVILMGLRDGKLPAAPLTRSAFPPDRASEIGTAVAPTVADAIGDLPALRAGEDGTHLAYRGETQSPYQALMRGEITADEYLAVYPTSAASPKNSVIQLRLVA